MFHACINLCITMVADALFVLFSGLAKSSRRRIRATSQTKPANSSRISSYERKGCRGQPIAFLLHTFHAHDLNVPLSLHDDLSLADPSMFNSSEPRCMFRDMWRCWYSRLQIASLEYHHQLSKKKVSEAIDEAEKLSVRDALGIVMITHGEEIGDESAFGTSTVLLAIVGTRTPHSCVAGFLVWVC